MNKYLLLGLGTAAGFFIGFLLGIMGSVEATYTSYYDPQNNLVYALDYVLPQQMQTFLQQQSFVYTVAARNGRTYITINATMQETADRYVKDLDTLVSGMRLQQRNFGGTRIPICEWDSGRSEWVGYRLINGVRQATRGDALCNFDFG